MNNLERAGRNGIFSTAVSKGNAAIPDSRLHALIQDNRCQSLVSLLIVTNAIFIGFSQHVDLRRRLLGGPEVTWIFAGEWFFCVAFTFELLLRLVAERSSFAFGRNCRWNAFDTSLVSVNWLDIVLSGMDSGGFGLASVMRILRLLRFFRLLRLTRVISNTYSLRLVLVSILNSVGSLFWCFLVIGLIMYIFSVLLCFGVLEHLDGIDVDKEDPEMIEPLREFFGDFILTMRSLFMVITGGIDWCDPVAPLTEISWIWEGVVWFYIFFMNIGVLNVVMGTFVASTAETASKDREKMEKEELLRLEDYMKHFRNFFEEADLDNSGTLSWEEFDGHLKDPKVSAFFQALELDVSQARSLFVLLDMDADGQVTMEEFLEGCVRLRGQARNLDVNMLLHSVQQAFEKMEVWQKNTERRMVSLQDKVGCVEPMC